MEMKILFCERNALMQKDMEEAFTRMNITFRCASYIFRNTDSDDYYCLHLRNFLTEDTYDAVFSFNFIPVIADVCHEMDIPYIAWNYDAGWEFHRKDALFYPTNHIFHFDRRACEDYKKSGYANIHHMPLAVNCHRLDNLQGTTEQNALYSHQVAFLGSAYGKYIDTMPEFFQYLDNNTRNNILKYVDNQAKQYDKHDLWDTFTETYVQQINSASHSPTFLPKLAFIANCSTMIAGRQRLELLNYVAERFPLTLYSTSLTNHIPKADYKWRASYYSQMPLIFRNSIINLNLTIPSIQTGIPLRVFDVLGSGGFLLTNEQEELSDYFRIGQDLDVYRSLEELNDKIIFYLAHPDIAKKIALQGHDVVKNAFSFEEQFHKMLTICNLTH